MLRLQSETREKVGKIVQRTAGGLRYKTLEVELVDGQKGLMTLMMWSVGLVVGVAMSTLVSV
jgi:hypothetical protein